MRFALVPSLPSNDADTTDSFDEPTGVFAKPTALPAPPRLPSDISATLPPPRPRRAPLFLVASAGRSSAPPPPPSPPSPPSAPPPGSASLRNAA